MKKNTILFILFLIPIVNIGIAQKNTIDITKVYSYDITYDSVTAWYRIYDRDIRKYGYCDKDGNVKIPFTYSWIGLFDKDSLANASKNNKSGFINTKNKITVPFIYDKLYSPEYGVAYAKHNGKYGWINNRGKPIIPFIYSDARPFYDAKLAEVRMNGKYGFIDTLGKVVIPIIYNEVDYTTIDDFVLAKKNGKWAFFDNHGKQMTGFEFDQIHEAKPNNAYSTYFKNGLALVEKNKKFAYVNENFDEIVPFGTFDYAIPLNKNGYSIVGKDSKYGIMNKNGVLKIPLQYDSLANLLDFHQESKNRLSFIAQKGSKYCILNTNAEWIPEIEYDSIELISCKNYKAYRNGKMFLLNENGEDWASSYTALYEMNYNSYIVKKDSKFGIIKCDNKFVIPFEYDSIAIHSMSEFIYAVKNYSMGVIDDENKIIIPFEYEYIDEACCYKKSEKEAFIVQKNNKFGTVDFQNNIIIPIEYDGISSWVEYGPNAHYVKKNGKYGLITHDGRAILQPDYDYIQYCTNDCILAIKNGKFGIINWNSKTVVPFIYDTLFVDIEYYDFENKHQDKIVVKKNGNWSYLDFKGKAIQTNISDKEIKKNYHRKDFKFNESWSLYLDYYIISHRNWKGNLEYNSENEAYIIK